jgi:hypothetical protein
VFVWQQDANIDVAMISLALIEWMEEIWIHQVFPCDSPIFYDNAGDGRLSEMTLSRPGYFSSLLPAIVALTWSIAALGLTTLQAQAAEAVADAPVRQILHFGGAASYDFAVYANSSLKQVPVTAVRAVVLVHGVKRNADDYFQVGLQLLNVAQLSATETLLLAPSFMTLNDSGASSAMPLWRGASWNQGAASVYGVKAVSSFQVLDDMVRYLADRQRFPALREIVMIGHSAGAQLMQRYAVVNDMDGFLQQAGLAMRYVISSPSSYVYFDANRPDGDHFVVPSGMGCPGYNHYRYGIDNPPDYLKRQGLSGRQLFQRYAARNIIYMVGARDDNAHHRFLDKSCGAGMQGVARVERQLNFVRYERFLSEKWKIPVKHSQFQVSGAAHEAGRLFRSEDTARKIFPSEE